jgi:hypothetical protein
MPSANLPVLDKSLRNWSKHLPDDFAMLLPVRRGTGPAIDDFLLGLHEQKYSLVTSPGGRILAFSTASPYFASNR